MHYLFQQITKATTATNTNTTATMIEIHNRLSEIDKI